MINVLWHIQLVELQAAEREIRKISLFLYSERQWFPRYILSIKNVENICVWGKAVQKECRSNRWSLNLNPIFLLVLCLNNLSNAISEVLKSSILIMWVCKSFCRSRNSHYPKLGTAMLGEYVSEIVESSHWIEPFIIM